MGPYLLDVNVLVALMWHEHEHHSKVQSWFARHSKSGWATCPFTQAGLVRILCNPALSSHPASPEQAIGTLRLNTQHTGHQFWKDQITVPQALEPVKTRLLGHRQITDAYLLALALHHKGSLATLDRSLPSLLPEEERENGTVVVL